MATTYAPNVSNLINNTAGAVQTLPDERVGGVQRTWVEKVTMAGAAVADQIVVARLPYGAVPLSMRITVDTSAGTGTTIAVGDKNNVSRFATAGTLTSTNTPTDFIKNGSAIGVPLTTCYDYAGTSNTNYEDIMLTIGVSSLTASGTMTIVTSYLDYSS